MGMDGDVNDPGVPDNECLLCMAPADREHVRL